MSVLQLLKDECVVMFDVVDKQHVEIEECCDNHFRTRLNKQQFGQMIEELKELHSKMVG